MTEDYITKVISDCLYDCTQIANAHKELKYIHKAIDNLSLRLQEPMQLAIVGRISSSKSTLVNAILGKAEVVRTGHEAETFNVSWLKYGSDDEPIKVFFKDGTQSVDVPRSSWAEWASHSGEEKLKAKVSYIEVRASDEILKSINIIDTPGLDATSKVDSENTIQFLKKVNPDAVVLLFTKSLSESSLRLIDEFQQSDFSNSYSINPMNALGVLSKPDLNWNVVNNCDVIEASKSAVARTLSGREDVRKALFRIIPVSALMGVASSCITDEDMSFFKKLSTISNPADIAKLFMSADFFVQSNLTGGVTESYKKAVVLKYGLYGIHVCVEKLKEDSDTDKNQLATCLKKKSGFNQFLEVLYSHFGDRSRVLKAQRSVASLLDACNRDSQDKAVHQAVIDKIVSRVMSIQEELHDLKEMDLLNKIYEGRLTIEPSFMNELKTVCGEVGDDVCSRLGVSDQMPVEDLMDISNERCLKWTRKYNALKRISEQKAYPYGVVSKSYALISKRLEEQFSEYKNAIRTISIFNRYVYGRTNV